MRENPKDNDQNFGATYVAPAGSFTKEQRDIALATTLLKTGVLTERQLSSAFTTWTLHGAVPLGDHLLKGGILTRQILDEAESQAEKRLATCQEDFTSSHNGISHSGSVVLRTLEVLDASGGLSRLLGIRGTAGAAAEEGHDTRKCTVRYKLLKKLGQGGLGRVWLAYDENLKRHVAVKEIASARDPIALKRFRREAEITGRLEHPGIVPIYELGEDAQTGETFYSMRFLGKQTLHDAILEYHERRADGTDDPMLIRRLLTSFVSVCQAIGHAHSRKVIHRDLKPENIAIDNFGQVIVIDWGLAKIVDETGMGDFIAESDSADTDSHRQTLDGQVLGTPLYMSPEQAAGRLDELNEKTDIYGLGAILFAILTGAAPHEQARSNTTIGGGGHRELLTAITSQEVPQIRQLNPNIPPALAAICQKALARRQYARYETATQLADDIQRWMAGESVSAYHEKFPQRISRWVQQHSILSQTIAAALTILIVSLITTGISASKYARSQHETRFHQLMAKEHEIHNLLRISSEFVQRDVRFMANQSAINGIMDAKLGSENGGTLSDWQKRLNRTYEGLLQGHPNYLAIGFYEYGKDAHPALVRVERQFSHSGNIRTQGPANQGHFSDDTMLEKIPTLYPGEVWLELTQEGATRGVVKMLGGTPVHDETTGQIFGFVVLETDFSEQVKRVFTNVELENTLGLLTDQDGNLWVEAQSRTALNAESSLSAAQLVPGTAAFFEKPGINQMSDPDAGWLASRIRLDRTNPATTIGIVLSLQE